MKTKFFSTFLGKATVVFIGALVALWAKQILDSQKINPATALGIE